MVIREAIKAIKLALENMDQNYCNLSQIDYNKIKIMKPFIIYLSKEKYLERPFAYEFYHQLRRLLDEGEVDFGGPIIQAEVGKSINTVLRRVECRILSFIFLIQIKILQLSNLN